MTQTDLDQVREEHEECNNKDAGLINDETATAIIQHITYNMLE